MEVPFRTIVVFYTLLWLGIGQELVYVHVVGMQQLQELGQFMRDRYMNYPNRFLSPNYTKSEIYIRSTDSDRALQSAAANLAGLYPPQGRQVWSNMVPHWQPVPIHSFMPKKKDLLLKLSSADCNNYDKAFERYEKDQLKVYDREYADFMPYIKSKLGYRKKMNVKKVSKWAFGPIASEIAEGLEQPNWLNETWAKRNQSVKQMIWEMKRLVKTMASNRADLSKYRAGYLLGDIIGRMNNVAHKEKVEASKMIVYSTHSGTLQPFMYNMGIANHQLTPFAAAILIELYKSNNQYLVQVSYRNQTDRPPFVLTVPGCWSGFCDFEQFKRSLNNRIYRNKDEWNEDCGNSASSLDDLSLGD